MTATQMDRLPVIRFPLMTTVWSSGWRLVQNQRVPDMLHRKWMIQVLSHIDVPGGVARVFSGAVEGIELIVRNPTPPRSDCWPGATRQQHQFAMFPGTRFPLR